MPNRSEITTFNMAVVKMDGTKYWDIRFLTKYGVRRIYTVSAVNLAVAVNLCELTPSYYLEFLEYQYELFPIAELSDEQFQELHEELYKNSPEQDEAYHCVVIENILKNTINGGELPKNGTNGGYLVETDPDWETEQQAIDAIREFACNSNL